MLVPDERYLSLFLKKKLRVKNQNKEFFLVLIIGKHNFAGLKLANVLTTVLPAVKLVRVSTYTVYWRSEVQIDQTV